MKCLKTLLVVLIDSQSSLKRGAELAPFHWLDKCSIHMYECINLPSWNVRMGEFRITVSSVEKLSTVYFNQYSTVSDWISFIY